MGVGLGNKSLRMGLGTSGRWLILAQFARSRQPSHFCTRGFEDSSSASIERAVQRLLRLLYAGMELPSEAINDLIPSKEERNREIYRRYVEGERAVDLAAEYRISLQRVYKVIRMGKRNQW